MYAITDIIIPFLISFCISLLFSPVVINVLKNFKIMQTIRKEGVKSHIKKMGTPTMGGLIIIFAVVVTALLYIKKYPEISVVLFVTIGFGIIGFMDDYLKVVMKDTKGLSPLQKITAQLVVASVLLFFIYNKFEEPFLCKMPFFLGENIQIPRVLGVILFIVSVLGTVNGVNFTDGIDGLASSVTMLVLTFFAVICVSVRSGLSPVVCATIGALIAFLIYNTYPARIFMGDTGSLALGGFVVAVALIMQMTLYLPFVGIIYLMEVLSVIIQVGYYKLTNGKRFFKMAPIHHHFELSGFKETQVVVLFSFITAIICIGMIFFE